MLGNKVFICGVDTSKLPVLKSNEKKELFEKILKGDEEAREKYIHGNLRLVLSIIQRFNNRGEYVDDIFQVGCIGLIKAIDNFDIKHGVQFSTYAVPMNITNRNSREKIYMTRKQALFKVLEILQQCEQTDQINEIRVKIKDLLNEIPLTRWSEDSIFDSFDQFCLDNGRNPTTTDMKNKKLPPHTTIKNKFGITAKQFLKTYYPCIDKCKAKGYEHKTKEEWLKIFIEDYNKIKPTSAEEFNLKRNKNTPSWATLAKLFDINLWSEFQIFCKLPTYTQVKKHKKVKKQIKLNSFSDLEAEYQKYLNSK